MPRRKRLDPDCVIERKEIRDWVGRTVRRAVVEMNRSVGEGTLRIEFEDGTVRIYRFSDLGFEEARDR